MASTEERILAVGDVELTIDLNAGARATRWMVGDLSLLATHGPGPVDNGMYPMAPWAGRLRDNSVLVDGLPFTLPATRGPWALHGTLLASPLAEVEHEQAVDHARLVARTAEDSRWPWPMEVDVTWYLRPRVLETTITVRALHRPFPAIAGWHPWFVRRLDRGGPLEWDMAASVRAERGGDALPTGVLLPYDPNDGPFDDAFHVPDGKARVRWPGSLTIDIDSDGTWFVMFDELPAAVCIEPQSGPPNGLNDGLGQPIPVAAPGRPHELTTRWIMRDDPPAGRG